MRFDCGVVFGGLLDGLRGIVYEDIKSSAAYFRNMRDKLRNAVDTHKIKAYNVQPIFKAVVIGLVHVVFQCRFRVTCHGYNGSALPQQTQTDRIADLDTPTRDRREFAAEVAEDLAHLSVHLRALGAYPVAFDISLTADKTVSHYYSLTFSFRYVIIKLSVVYIKPLSARRKK